MNVVGAVSGILASLIVVLVTLRKTWSHVKMASTLGIHVDVSTILLRDGKQLYEYLFLAK